MSKKKPKWKLNERISFYTSKDCLEYEEYEGSHARREFVKEHINEINQYFLDKAKSGTH